MKKLVTLLGLFLTINVFANDTAKLYDPTADVKKDITRLLEQAKKENKNLMLQIGGNWCVWCHRFNTFVQTDNELKESLDKNYIVYHFNYSPENKNLDYLKKLDFPQRFGFPVLVILDSKGNRIHTQDTALLEEGSGYNKKKVKTFFLNWAPVALSETSYKE